MKKYDTVIFINMNHHLGINAQGYGLGDGYRRYSTQKRGMSPCPLKSVMRGHVEVRTWSMSFDSGVNYSDTAGKYIEISLHQLADTDADIPEFKNLTSNSKIILAGHGGAGIDFIESDDSGGGARQDFPLTSMAKFIATNISKYAPGLFSQNTSPLQLTMMSCQAAAPNAGYGVGMEGSMAGRLLQGLRALGVYARIRAYSTSISAVTNPRTYLGLSSEPTLKVWRRATVRVAKNVIEALSGPNGGNKDYIQLYKDSKKLGFKRIFEWNAAGQMRVTDKVTEKEVDPFFEASKDRVLEYLYLFAFFKQGHKQGATPVKEALVNLSAVVETAPDVDGLAKILDAAANDPKHGVNFHTGASIFATFSNKMLRFLSKKLKAGAEIPPPKKDDYYLGI